MPLIEIEGLTHRFADKALGIEGINLTIEAGEFVVIAGRNGSGKTTLIRHLNGLLRASSGSVKLDGIPVEKDLKRARQIVGMVFQDADSQIVGETVYDDAAFGPSNLKLDRVEIDRRVREALASVGLTGMADMRPHLLSGGEKRRLAIAGILAMDPRIIVFDEPFSNLDFHGVRQVLTQMVRLHRQGRTIIVTTHDLEKVISHAGRLIVIESGRMVLDGRPQGLLPVVESHGIRRPCLSRLGMEVESWLS